MKKNKIRANATINNCIAFGFGIGEDEDQSIKNYCKVYYISAVIICFSFQIVL